MKIVAFVDTLGFKQKISSINHEQAKKVITVFNAEIYKLWEKYNYNNNNEISGHTFSDSLIIYTDNDTVELLNKVLTFLSELYKLSITICDLPLRGGISIGEFDKIPSIEFSNLKKNLVVGSAFIDAYFLESSHKIKGSKIVFRSNIHEMITKKLPHFISKELVKLDSGEYLYELPWGDLEYLKQNDFNALNKFVELAVNSKWLDHYYHTLDTFLNKRNKRKSNYNN